jgi:endonuclease/exonuclease/phosphatase family metal-dependent hydrolase
MIKIVTFNIRCDYGMDGENNFEYRKDLISRKIYAEQPDILCFQEVLPHVAAWLREVLTDYYVIGCGREASLQGEQTTVAYRRERLNLISMESYWLSETPEQPGSRYSEQSDCPRICTEVVLQDQDSGQVFRLVNTHLDHIGAGARILGLKQILQKLSQETFFCSVPTILAGDMNAEPDSEEMRVFEQFPGYINATEGIGVTFHAFGKKEEEMSIDYIFLKSCSCNKTEKWTEQEGSVYLSDHYPVCAWIEFPNQS